MAELVPRFCELRSLPQGLHWFCEASLPPDSASADQPPSNGDSHLAKDVQFRRDQAAESLLLYTFDDAPDFQQQLTSLIDLQLGRCDLCVEEYYKARKRLDERLRHDYEDENVDLVEKKIDERDFQRIKRGLDNATRILQRLEPSQRHKNALEIDSQLALFEVLCNDAFILDTSALQEHFEIPFRLVQTKKRLNIARYVPAATAFLFDQNQGRHEWAMQTWSKYRSSPTIEEFGYAIKDPLMRHLHSLSLHKPDNPTLQRTWDGMGQIVSTLNNDLVTHSLRALDIDVFKLALDHLRFDAPSLTSLVETIQKLLEVAPKDFWDAMGTISPTTFVEQIFNNVQFDRFLEASKPSDIEEASPLRDLLSWIKPFMTSLDTAHQAGVCRALAFQLLQRLQADRFPECARVECYRTGIATLAWTLSSLNRDSSLSSTGRIIAKDVLEVVSDYIDEIASIPSRPSGVWKEPCLELCLRIVKLALALDCKSVQTDQESVKHMKDVHDLPAGYGAYAIPVWEAVIRNLGPSNVDLAKAALVGINDLTGYEKFKVNSEEPHAKEKSAYNMKLGNLTHKVCQLLERITDFKPRDLDQLYESPDSATALVSSLFSADSNLFEAGVNLVKSLSAELARREAIGHLLKTFLETTLNACSWAIHRIAKNKIYSPCPRMLKTSSDVIDVLCNSENGLLRTVGVAGPGQSKAIETFWQYQWEGLRTIYEMTELWGRTKVEDHGLLKEFCRDTMQASERLFDQYSVFASALQSPSRIKLEPGDDKSPTVSSPDVSMELLRHPVKTMPLMVKWLRLRDLFLVEIAVKLTKKVLSRLTEHKKTVDDGTQKMLEQIIVGGPQGRTHLSPQEKAEIRRALEANIGRSIIQVHDVDSETASDHNPIKLRTKSKTAPIDLESWRAQEGREAAKAAAQVIEVSDEDEYGRNDVLDQDMLSTGQSVEAMQKIGVSVIGPVLSRKALPVHKKSVEPGRLSKAIQKPIKALPSEAEQASFREKRKKEQEAARKRKEERSAMIKKRAGVSAQVPGQGSALNGLGVVGKDHAPQGPSMMFSSQSERSDSEDDHDQDILGLPRTMKTATAVTEYRAGRAQALRAPVKKTKQARSAKDMRARLAPDLTALHREILSWDFFHNGDLPPSYHKRDYQLVSSSFRTPLDYQSTFEPLLLLEAWQHFLQSREDGNYKTFETKVASRMTVDAFSEVSTTLPSNEVKDLALGEADIVLLSRGRAPARDAQEPHCFARVWKINRKKSTVEVTYRVNISGQLVGSMAPNTTLYCAKVLTITPLEREYGALQGLMFYDLCDEITKAKPSPLLPYSEKQLTPLIDNYKINLAQAKAVRSAIDNDAFELIQGPPGSGKTKTIVAIVGALLTDALGVQGQAIARVQDSSFNINRAATKKLLVCAPSNAAVDELVMRFKQGVRIINGEHRALSVIRLGRCDAINAKVLDVTLEELVNAKLNLTSAKTSKPGDEVGALMAAHKVTCEEFNNLRATVDSLKASGKPVSPEQDRDMEQLKRKKDQLSKQIDTARDSGDMVTRNAEISRRRMQQEILDGAHVICATLSGSGHEMFQNLNIEFETVIIDEAAQCNELSALIPLKYGCSKCIMVGDPKQLPPTVLSREAAKFRFEQSLFVRMQENHPLDVHLLDTQYRMHPEISLFPSKAFYDGRLVDGEHMVPQRTRPWHESSILGPYRFFDVQGFHRNAPRGHSLINLAEIEVALKLYSRLTTDCKGYDFRGKIGIITPYKSQLRELRSRFASRYGDEILTFVEFNTTDAFQGRESEVVIFSCVRASLTRGIGFLSDIRRMNVGITRAKSSLWLLGNSQSLMQGEFWNSLIEDAKRRNLHTSGDLDSLLQKPLLTMSAQSNNPPQAGLILAAQATVGRADVEMPDAPPHVRSEPLRPGSPCHGVSPQILNEQLSDQPSGGRNGLNTNLNCGTCGSFNHQTHHCHNTEALESAHGRCHRCGELGHSRLFCKAELCFSCGGVGHARERCTNSKILTYRERQELGRQEMGYQKQKSLIPEIQRKKQLGDHDVKVPAVQPTTDSASLDESRKRKRNGSRPPNVPKEPKLGNRNSAAAKEAKKLSTIGNPSQQRKENAKPSPKPSVLQMPNGHALPPNNHGSSMAKPTKENHLTNPGHSQPAPYEDLDGLPDSSPRTIIKRGEGNRILQPLAPKPPAPGPAMVRPPKKKKKDVDPFIRPKNKR